MNELSRNKRFYKNKINNNKNNSRPCHSPVLYLTGVRDAINGPTSIAIIIVR